MQLLFIKLFYLFPFITTNTSITTIEKNVETTYYQNIQAEKYGLSKSAFFAAIKGYNKLKTKGLLHNNRYLTICDMSLSSKKKRLFVIDMVTQKIKYCLRVAHGQGSGNEYANKFSNIEDSHQTSLGFYITGGEYTGDNGLSMKLKGQEKGINDNADNRAIVLHGSEYVTDSYYKANQKIGRSWGCPAIDTKLTKPIIQSIKNGSCLFIYHSSKEYRKKSAFIK